MSSRSGAGAMSSSSHGSQGRQATLHRFFGPSVIVDKKGRRLQTIAAPPMSVTDWNRCPDFNFKATTKQALVSYRKTHARQMGLVIGGKRAKPDYSRRTKDNRSHNRGSAKRHRYSFKEKLELIQRCDTIAKALSSSKSARSKACEVLSEETGVSKANLLQWTSPELRSEITSRVAESGGEKKSTYNRKWLVHLRALEVLLARDVRSRRRRGDRVTKRWAIARAKQIRVMPSVVPLDMSRYINLSNKWYYGGFLPRHDFSLRVASNRKRIDRANVAPVLFGFHQEVDALYRAEPHVDPVFGAFKPSNVFNFDQVPLPFVCDSSRKTVDDRGRFAFGAASLNLVSKRDKRLFT